MKALIAAALLLLAASANAGVVGALADISVFVRTAQRALPVHWSAGSAWVAGAPGNEYAIRIRNRSGADLLAVISVDGVNAITGATASPDQSGYIVPAYESIEIKGWRKSLRRVASFYFTDLGDSYAARTGRPENVGVIGVALFKRKPTPELQLEEGKRERGRSDAGSDGAGLPSAPSSTGEPRRETSEKDAARSKLGTGHGRSQTSHVRYADFERESSTPNEVITLRYDSRDNLIALGVLPEPRRRPDPFPAFVPDPG